MNMTDDATLLHRFARENSSAAFGELVGRYLPLVYSAAVRRLAGDTHRAEEVAQAVFSTLARHAARLAEHPNLTAWLYTTTRNEVLDELRQEKRRRARETNAYIMNTTREEAESSPEWTQLAPVLDDALDQLGPADREAVLLRFFRNLPFGEIGGVLGVSEEAARKRVDRALDKLHGALRDRGIASSSGALALALTAEAALPVSSGLAAAIMATSAASGAAAVGTGAFFAMTKLHVALGAAILLSTAATVVYYSRDSAVPPSALPLAAPTAPVRPPEPLAVTPPLPLPAPVVTPPTPAPASIDVAQARREFARRWLEYAESPEFVRERIEVGLSRMMDASQELFALLGLTPEQTRQLAVLLTEKRLAPTNVALAQLRAGVLPDSSTDEFHQQVIAERAKTDLELKAFLGEARFRQVEDYYRGRAEESVFIRLGRTLGQTPDALTPAQTEQLRRSLREQPDASQLTPGIIAGARGFLTPVQVEALEQAHRTQVETRLQRFEEALPPPPPEIVPPK